MSYAEKAYAEQTYTTGASNGPPSVSPTLDRIEKATAVLNEALDLLFKRLEMVTRSRPTVSADSYASEALTSVVASTSPLVERLLSTERRLNNLGRLVQDQTDALDVP